MQHRQTRIEAAPRVEIDQLENIAALVIHLHEWMFLDGDWDATEWPRRYRYESFNGISGWWCYLARCAGVFASIRFPDDDFMEAMLTYAESVRQATFERRGPLEDEELQGLLHDTINVVRQPSAESPWDVG